MVTAFWGIDVDGPLYNFGESMKVYLRTLGWEEGRLTDPEHWDFHEAWGMDKNEFYKHFADGVNAEIVFLEGNVDPDALRVLKKLRRQKQKINIVTHRGKIGNLSEYNTVRWLKRDGIPYDSITFSKDKTIVKNDVFIEDNADNHTALREAGIASFLIDKPWNRYLDTGYRVYSWDEFYERAREELDIRGIK
jgi:uncharacterized HAD superfamily protein